MEITLNLPKKIYLDLSKSAQNSRWTFDEVVSERLQNKSENPLTGNSDEEVLEAAKLWMPEKQSESHSRLLYKNQAEYTKHLIRDNTSDQLIIKINELSEVRVFHMVKTTYR